MSETANLNPEESESMQQEQFTIRRLNDGFGYGEGTISGVDEEPTVLSQADRLIESQAILTPIDVDKETQELVSDDGCGDGREVGTIQRLQTKLNRSLHRAKVFGGGLVMAAATRISLGYANDQSFTENLYTAMDELDKKSIDYGAHTGHVTSENDSGCGAIDKNPKAVENTVIYAEPIRDSIKALGVTYEGFDDDYEEIIANNAAFVEANRGKDFSGAAVMERIKKAGKVVKDLVHGHAERRIVINMVPGYTVDQDAVRVATGKKVQVFVTDVPRLQAIAQKLYENPDDQRKAFLAQLVYTLGVAATLTKGDLPVYVVEQAADAPAA